MEKPDFRTERQLARRGVWPVAGVDEAGAGRSPGPSRRRRSSSIRKIFRAGSMIPNF